MSTFNGDMAALPLVAAPPPPAASATPRPNATAAPSGGGGPVAGSHGLTGRLTLCNAGKTVFATNERICFVESIRNTLAPRSATASSGCRPAA